MTKRMVPVEINWNLTPNLAMKPVNKVAQDIYAKFLASIGSNGQVPAGPNSWVLTKNVIRRRAFDPDSATGTSEAGLIRQHPTARQRREIPVLGTIAQPMVETV